VNLRVALAGRYDRVQSLLDGRIRVAGDDVDFTVYDRPPDAFRALTGSAEFDLGELSLSFYTTMRSRRDSPRFVALPIFLSRSFRRGNVYVRAESSAHSFEDLVGGGIALAEYGMTMAVYIRGMLQDEYGLSPAQFHWITTRAAIVAETTGLPRPAGVDIRAAEPHGEPLELLRAGAVDAMIGAPPMGTPGVRRLVDDDGAADRRAFERTGVFPIMHVLVMRASRLAERPVLAGTIYEAFCSARDEAVARLGQTNVPYVSLPWLDSAISQAWARTGGDLWPYGVRRNEPTLSTFLRYLAEQGLMERTIDSPEELFVPQLRQT
jgi:4,5-dihydroxyphthalate decarboxylase